MHLGIKIVSGSFPTVVTHSELALSFSSLFLSWCWATFLLHCARAVALVILSVKTLHLQTNKCHLVGFSWDFQTTEILQAPDSRDEYIWCLTCLHPHLKAWRAGGVGYMPLINLLPLCSKCTFIACFAIMELNLVNISPWQDGTMLGFVKRMHRRDTGRGRSLSFWYQYAALSRLLQTPGFQAPSSCGAQWQVAPGTSSRVGNPLNSLREQLCWCNE